MAGRDWGKKPKAFGIRSGFSRFSAATTRSRGVNRHLLAGPCWKSGVGRRCPSAQAEPFAFYTWFTNVPSGRKYSRHFPRPQYQLRDGPKKQRGQTYTLTPIRGRTELSVLKNRSVSGLKRPLLGAKKVFYEMPLDEWNAPCSFALVGFPLYINELLESSPVGNIAISDSLANPFSEYHTILPNSLTMPHRDLALP